MRAESRLPSRCSKTALRLEIVNVVSTADLAQTIDLVRVGRLPHCKYDAAIYSCAYVQSPMMHSKVSVFRTGKMISVGTRHEKRAADDLNFVCDYLAGKGLIKRQELDTKTRNIVASLEIGHS